MSIKSWFRRLFRRLFGGAYLNHDEITELIRNGEMKFAARKCINTASLDVRLGHKILVEVQGPIRKILDYRRRDQMTMEEVFLPDDGYVLKPGEFILAHTMEVCNFADDTAALFRSTSSMGRIALEHMDAGWIDPGFHGALTLEFVNCSRYHSIRIRTGDRVGQLVFFKGEKVIEEHSYRTVGNYNGEMGVAQIRFKDEK